MNPYEDIIHLPHHISKKRQQMSMADRAAQFSPFAALTGYEEAVAEAARWTDKKIELDESAQAELNQKQSFLINILSEEPEITVSYFKKDEKKAGGAYYNLTAKLQKIDVYNRQLLFVTGEKIPFDDILDIQSEYFPSDMD